MADREPNAIPGDGWRCQAINEFASLRCRHDSTFIVTTGCVHEHIGSKATCERHAAGLARGRVGCWVCHETDGHFCAMNVIEQVPIDA
ncbi:hypothetical protein [Nonomuraea sp. NPDC050202]|uniref:hypothetical protein n=1 Tax=Nonomuraea sp. NPDC050202 TaxID=3155035 RepID=UPI003405AFA5